MITVVIPLYNKEAFIAETIESVLRQTREDFELIVVDDGSTDNSIKVVSAFNDPRLRLIKQVNAGVSVARNNGIQAATHVWIAFLDADDWWAPTFLQEMTNAIKKFPQNVLFASGRCRVFASEEERYMHTMLPKDGETNRINYYHVISKYLPLINSSNVVIRKSHFENAGYFRPGQKQYEDHDLWMRLAIRQNVVFVNNNLSFYRKTVSGSASENEYVASDFNTYLQTIISVKQKLSEQDRRSMNQYASRFCLLTYLKQYGNYKYEERRLLENPLKQLISGKYRYLYILSKSVPFNLYKILKKLKA